MTNLTERLEQHIQKLQEDFSNDINRVKIIYTSRGIIKYPPLIFTQLRLDSWRTTEKSEFNARKLSIFFRRL